MTRAKPKHEKAASHSRLSETRPAGRKGRQAGRLCTPQKAEDRDPRRLGAAAGDGNRNPRMAAHPLLGVEGAAGATRQSRAGGVHVASGLPEGVTWEQINWAALSTTKIRENQPTPPADYFCAKVWAVRFRLRRCQARKRCEKLVAKKLMKSMPWKTYIGNKAVVTLFKWVGPIPKEFILAGR
jgi:hypothetical protein